MHMYITVAFPYQRDRGITDWYQSLSSHLMWVTTYIKSRALTNSTTRTYLYLDFRIPAMTTRVSHSIDNPFLITTKPFVPSIWGRLHEPKENYAEWVTLINFLHSFLSSNMPTLRPLASISCRITSIHVFFGLRCALLTCPKLICSTRRLAHR